MTKKERLELVRLMGKIRMTYSKHNKVNKKEIKSKSVLSREMYLDYLSDQYNKKGTPFLEAASFHEGDTKLVAVGGNGLQCAFAEHLPLGFES
jgi:hypothetical protein